VTGGRALGDLFGWLGGKLLGRGAAEVAEGATATSTVAEEGVGSQASRGVNLIQDYLGEGATASKEGGSDLILRSADGSKQIRFDLINSHGDAPHINFETWKPRNLYPGDKRMIQLSNEHIYPKP
jgi:hypothetical protein